MSLKKAIEDIEERGDISQFAESLNPLWIEEALNASGTASVRRRKLPANQVVWLVIGMAMFANRSIRHIVERLQLVVHGLIYSSSTTEARYRLGAEPLKWLFNRVAQAWDNDSGNTSNWQGLRLYGLDGTHLRVPDSDANFSHFGKPSSSRSVAGYPQLRLAALMNLQTRLLCAAEMGPWKSGEVTLSQDLWSFIPEQSLTIIDRGFFSYMIFLQILAEKNGRHFLCRTKKNTKIEITKYLSDGTALAFLYPIQKLRQLNPGLPDKIEVRVIRYQRENGEVGEIITSLIDETIYSADELIELYHTRWELEIAFDELKTDMLERQEAIRSQKPEGVYQEVWGILLTYNLIRREMYAVSQSYGVQPNRLSFKASLLMIRDFFIGSQFSAPGTLPRELAELRTSIRQFLLPERRKERRYPRHVKIKMTHYKKNRGKRKLKQQAA